MGSRLHGNYGRRRAIPQSSFPRRRESTEGAGDGFPSPRERRWAAAGAPTNDGRRRAIPQSSFPRRRESTAGAGDGVPYPRERREAAAHPQTTVGGGRPTIVIPATAGIHRGGPAMGSRLHAGTTGGGGAPTNDGRRRAIPQSSFPRRRESTEGGPAMGFPSPRKRRWAAAGAPTNDGRRRAIPQSSFPRRRESTAGGGDGFPSPRELRAAAAHPQTTGGGGRSHNRHSRDGGNPPRGPAMGSRIHGNDGRRRRTHKRQWAAGDPTIVIPATAGIHRGGRRWVPVSTGNGRRRAPTNNIGGGRSHKRREAAGDPTIVIPATAGIHGEGRRWGSRLHGNDGGRRQAHPQTTGDGGRSHNRHSRDGGNPQRGAGDGFPSPRERHGGGGGDPQTTGGGGRSHNRHSRDGGNPRGPAMGFPSPPGRRTHKRRAAAPTNDGRRRAIPQSSFPRRRESTEGAGDGVPSPRERREAAAHPQTTLAAAHPQTTGGGGRSHNRHSRDGGNPQRGAGDGVPSPRERRWAAAGAPTNYGRRRRTHNRQVSGEAFVPSTLNSYDDYASLTVILAVDTITRSNCRFGSRASDSHVTSPF